MSVDTISNFLTIIRNALMVSKPTVFAPYSKMNLAISHILQEEGFLRGVSIVEEESTHKRIKIILKYVDGESVIHELSRVSKPGRRVYAGAEKIKPVIGGLGFSILSTSKGVLTNKKAKELGVGGELLCTVW
jgi:small subunit ribosomal protein S8